MSIRDRISLTSELALWSSEAVFRVLGREDAAAIFDFADDVRLGYAYLGPSLRLDQTALLAKGDMLAAQAIPLLMSAGQKLWRAYLKSLTSDEGYQREELYAAKVAAIARPQWITDVRLGPRLVSIVEDMSAAQIVDDRQRLELIAAVAFDRVQPALRPF